MAKRFLVMIALLMLGFYVVGCAEGDESASVVNPNPSVFKPIGYINGVVADTCTGAYIDGATIYVAFNGKQYSTKTKGGVFSFAKLPVNVSSGSVYYVTCDLSTVTGNPYSGKKLVSQVSLAYEDLDDGDNNDGNFTESGSGASTPVDGLTASVEFGATTVTASVAGIVIDQTYGNVPLSGATVALFDADNNLITSTTTSATGAFALTGVPAQSGDDDPYKIMITKSGYTYWDVADSTNCGDADGCNMLELPCTIGCNASVPINVGAFFVMQSVLRDYVIPFIAEVDAQIGTYSAANIFDGDEFAYDDDGETLSALVTSFGVTFSEAMLTGHSSIYQGVKVYNYLAVNVTTEGETFTFVFDDADEGVWTIDNTDSEWTTIGVDYFSYTLAWDATGKVLTITPAFDEDSVTDLAKESARAKAVFFGTDNTTLATATIEIVSGLYEIVFAEGGRSLSLADANGVMWWHSAYSWGTNYYMSTLSGIQAFILGAASNDMDIWVGDENYYDVITDYLD